MPEYETKGGEFSMKGVKNLWEKKLTVRFSGIQAAFFDTISIKIQTFF